jgi:hypothetical protein
MLSYVSSCYTNVNILRFGVKRLSFPPYPHEYLNCESFVLDSSFRMDISTLAFHTFRMCELKSSFTVVVSLVFPWLTNSFKLSLPAASCGLSD